VLKASPHKEEMGSRTADAETQAKRERFRELTSKDFEDRRSTGKGPSQETMLQKCPGKSE